MVGILVMVVGLYVDSNFFFYALFLFLFPVYKGIYLWVINNYLSTLSPHKMNSVLPLGCVIVQEVPCCQLGLCSCPSWGQGWKHRCDQARFPTEEELPPGSGKPPAFVSRVCPLCAGDTRKPDQT